MNYNFTGALTQRNINLGSAQEISSVQLAQQARDQRAVRQEIRARHVAATRIQSIYRGRRSAGSVRAERQKRAIVLLARLDETVWQGGSSDWSEAFLQCTQFVAASTQRNLVERRWNQQARNSASQARLSSSEQAALDLDDKLLLSWAQVALTAAGGVEMSKMMTQLKPDVRGTQPSAQPLKRLLSTLMLHLAFQPAQSQQSYQPYLELFAMLLNDSKGNVLAQDWALWLVNKGLYASLKAHILVVTADSKPSAPSLTTAVAIALTILRLFPPTASTTLSPSRQSVLRGFVEAFLTIQNLLNRVPRASLAMLAIELPVVEIAELIVSQKRGPAEMLRFSSVDLLANYVALASKRVVHLPNGASIKSYLLVLTALQDDVPSGLLYANTGPPNSKAIATAAMLEEDDDGAELGSMLKAKSVAKGLDPATLNRLQILVSQDHITALLSASAKYPNSTREALCAFLTSALQSWDAQTQDKILSCIAYRYSGISAIAAGGQALTNARSAQHSIGGLVRELWRGWLRGSKLARSLSSESLQNRKGLLSALADETLRDAWPCLVILCQLYSRSLLTIGDDEFYPQDSSFGGSTSQTSTSSMRNPLSLDEIVVLSGLLRNLAFAMFWFEGTGGALNDLSHNCVAGSSKMDLLSLRNIVTRLLQQLHQRDSRRRFVPDGHWLMNSELDLTSFIQSVVMEEDELNARQEDEQENATEDAMDIDGGYEDDALSGEDDAILRSSATRRPAISARLANRRSGRAQNHSLSARNLAYLSPRLGVLNNIPFAIPFEVRVEIFHQFTALDYARLRRQNSYHGVFREVTIRRGSVAEDGFKQLNGMGENLKHRFAIKFIDQFGIEESGIDGGGLFKEFLTSLIKEAFDTDRGLWSATSDQQLYPNPHSYARQEENLQWYRFLGRVLGKALYHGILVDINFASFFLSKWLGRGHGYLDDLSGLESLDKEVYRNLLWLKHYSGDVEKDLALDFTVIDEEFGEKRVHELVPNGKSTPVTRENRLEYIYRVSHYRLNEQIRLQSEAFMSGLTDLIDLRWLRMLNREELRILISGTEGDIDLNDLRANTILGGYHEKDEVLQFFWQSLASFTHAQRKSFLKFATSCPSPPLLGFGQLNPKFGIRHAGDDTDRLPTASTCVNLLKLPRYTSLKQCQEKLLYAIESGAGFDLS